MAKSSLIDIFGAKMSIVMMAKWSLFEYFVNIIIFS